jgi:CheY-like chemotaxis protein
VGRKEASLAMAHRLAKLGGGKLVISPNGDAFNAWLTFPALEQLPVLVIDDNADTLQLFRRYTSGTRYRIVGIRDPEQVLKVAEESSPRIIVLDVMMPQKDGWEVLGWLREHPLTRPTPVVVCTILAQEELALSLGASGFLQKPVSRQSFLAALDRQLALMETESR